VITFMILLAGRSGRSIAVKYDDMIKHYYAGVDVR
jgi:hypothetical protein